MSDDKWLIYDQLLATVPVDDRLEKIHLGSHWLMLETAAQAFGLAQCVSGGQALDLNQHLGRSLREVAALIKSWNFQEAAVGLAAINAHLNTRDELDRAAAAGAGSIDGDAFDLFLGRVRGKKVAIIGRFPYLERLAPQCQSLIVFERNPGPNDLPDSAAEFLLPEQELVFITSTAIINKTLPRLLELCVQAGAGVGLVGPSTPLTPLLFQHGIEALSGLLPVDQRKVAEVVVREDSCIRLFAEGVQKVNLTKI
jgi:Uncharacterized conserved protein